MPPRGATPAQPPLPPLSRRAQAVRDRGLHRRAAPPTTNDATPWLSSSRPQRPPRMTTFPHGGQGEGRGNAIHHTMLLGRRAGHGRRGR